MKLNKPILVVEDSDEDFYVFLRIKQELGIPQPIHRTHDGDEALDYLYNRGDYEDQAQFAQPKLIVMDLNLPGTDGREVIHDVKQDASLKHIPIVVLTTSSSPKDIEICYQYGINSYLLKPIGVKSLKTTIQLFFQYWFELTLLPRPE